jgi:hypothetical protein
MEPDKKLGMEPDKKLPDILSEIISIIIVEENYVSNSWK